MTISLLLVDFSPRKAPQSKAAFISFVFSEAGLFECINTERTLVFKKPSLEGKCSKVSKRYLAVLTALLRGSIPEYTNDILYILLEGSASQYIV